MKDVNVPAGYKSTDVGVIPEDWEVNKLSSVSNVKTGPFGSALHEKDYVEDGTPIITVEHLGEPRVLHNNLPMVSDFDKQRLKAYELKIDDIVFSRVGSVDRNSLITDKEDGWLFSSRLLRIRPNKKYIFSTFLSYFFHYEPSKQRIRNVAVGQTMPSLNTKILNEIEIPIPTLSEQKTIARVLSDVDELIRECDSLIAKKRDIKQGTMQQLLTGKKRLPGFSGKWVMVTFNDIGQVIDGDRGKNYPNTNDFNSDGYCLFLSTKNVTKRGFYFSECSFITKKKDSLLGQGKLIRNDIVLTTRGTVGNIAFFAPCISFNNIRINSGMVILRNTSSCSDTHFIYIVFKSRIIQQQIDKVVFGSAQPQLTVKIINQFQLPLPPLAEQKAIARVLSDMDAEIEVLEKKRDKYKAIKQGMMQELLTGKTRLIDN